MRRCAAALPMVLALLGLMGALTIGGAYATRRHLGDVRRLDRGVADLRSEAERAALGVLSGLDSAALAGLPVGATQSASTADGNLAVTSAWVTRLSGAGIWIVVESKLSSNALLALRLGLFVERADDSLGPVVRRQWYHLP